MSTGLDTSNFDSVARYLINQEGVVHAPQQSGTHRAFRAASNANALVNHVLFQGTPTKTLGNLAPEKIHSVDATPIRHALTSENRETVAKRLVKAYLQTRDQAVRAELRNLYEKIFSPQPTTGEQVHIPEPTRSPSPPQREAQAAVRLRPARTASHARRETPPVTVAVTKEERSSEELVRRRLLTSIREGAEAPSLPRSPAPPTPTAPVAAPISVVQPVATSARASVAPSATAPSLSRSTDIDNVYRLIGGLLGRTIPPATGTLVERVNYAYAFIKADLNSRNGIENKTRRFEEYREVIDQLYGIIGKDIEAIPDLEDKLRRSEEYKHIFNELDRFEDVLSLAELSTTIGREREDPTLYLPRVHSLAYLDPSQLLSVINTALASTKAKYRDDVLDLTNREVYDIMCTIIQACSEGAHSSNGELYNLGKRIADNYNPIRNLERLTPREKLIVALHFAQNSPITDARLSAKVQRLHLQPVS